MYSFSEKTERELLESLARPRRTRSRRFPSLGCIRMKRVPNVPLRRSRWLRAIVESVSLRVRLAERLGGRKCKWVVGRKSLLGGSFITEGLLETA